MLCTILTLFPYPKNPRNCSDFSLVSGSHSVLWGSICSHSSACSYFFRSTDFCFFFILPATLWLGSRVWVTMCLHIEPWRWIFVRALGSLFKTAVLRPTEWGGSRLASGFFCRAGGLWGVASPAASPQRPPCLNSPQGTHFVSLSFHAERVPGNLALGRRRCWMCS